MAFIPINAPTKFHDTSGHPQTSKHILSISDYDGIEHLSFRIKKSRKLVPPSPMHWLRTRILAASEALVTIRPGSVLDPSPRLHSAWQQQPQDPYSFADLNEYNNKVAGKPQLENEFEFHDVIEGCTLTTTDYPQSTLPSTEDCYHSEISTEEAYQLLLLSDALPEKYCNQFLAKRKNAVLNEVEVLKAALQHIKLLESMLERVESNIGVKEDAFADENVDGNEAVVE